MDLCFLPVKKRRYAVGRAREGAGGGIPPPLATCENEWGRYEIRRNGHMDRTPSA